MRFRFPCFFRSDCLTNHRKLVGSSTLKAYALRNGRPVLPGESPYAVCSQVLTANNHKAPDGFSPRAHCKAFAHIIIGVAKNYRAKCAEQNLTVRKTYAATDEFLKSFEWRRVRMAALKLYGPKCQCCGATPASGAVMNVDHILPRKTHPELCLSLDNLQVLCDACNHGKGNWDTTDWRTA